MLPLVRPGPSWSLSLLALLLDAVTANAPRLQEHSCEQHIANSRPCVWLYSVCVVSQSAKQAASHGSAVVSIAPVSLSLLRNMDVPLHASPIVLPSYVLPQSPSETTTAGTILLYQPNMHCVKALSENLPALGVVYPDCELLLTDKAHGKWMEHEPQSKSQSPSPVQHPTQSIALSGLTVVIPPARTASSQPVLSPVSLGPGRFELPAPILAPGKCAPCVRPARELCM